jgi:glycosyltransferase involved in cell wall biosynthesis
MASEQRIAVLGPLPPTRGGIARHTALTAAALAERASVKVWSYRRQYPKFLYPGKSEVSADLPCHNDLDERRIVDGINPLTWVRTVREISAWEPHLLVFPVWTFFQAPALGWTARSLRNKGCETCAIVHNVFDHAQAFWKARLSLWSLGQADRYVTHGPDLADQIRSHFPGARVGVFPIPLFDDFPPATHILKREYTLELLFYGLVRPYKGLDVALHALALSGRKDVRLTVAGEFWQGLAETRALIETLGISDQVDLIPEYISDADTAELFDRSDAVVLPYRSVTGSGIVATAFHYQRPVIVSDHPALRDLVEQFDAGWVFPSEQPQALADILKSLDREATERAGINSKSSAAFLTWHNYAARVLGDDIKDGPMPAAETEAVR